MTGLIIQRGNVPLPLQAAGPTLALRLPAPGQRWISLLPLPDSATGSGFAGVTSQAALICQLAFHRRIIPQLFVMDYIGKNSSEQGLFLKRQSTASV